MPSRAALGVASGVAPTCSENARASFASCMFQASLRRPYLCQECVEIEQTCSICLDPCYQTSVVTAVVSQRSMPTQTTPLTWTLPVIVARRGNLFELMSCLFFSCGYCCGLSFFCGSFVAFLLTSCDALAGPILCRFCFLASATLR